MKKTTYILIGVIALTAVAAFLVPPMLFKPSSTVFLGGGMCPAKTTNSFSSLSISYEKHPRLRNLPSIEITETDSATAPTITLSEALDENARIDTAGNTLAIIIDLHTSASGDMAGHNVAWETCSLPVAALTVPRGMLKNITATDAAIRLNGFTAPVRFSATSEMSLDGCGIPIMEICGRIQDANVDSKIDLRGNSRIGKLDVTDTDIIIDSDESSTIDTLVTRSRHASNNIFSQNSTIKNIINESNTDTHIHIAGKATIK